MISRFTAGAALVMLVFLIGCGGAQAPKSAAPGVGQSEKPAAREAGGKAGEAGDQTAVKAANGPAERKIIYTATLELIVKDLDDVLPQVEKLVAAHKGYVAKSEVKGDTGTRRTATYSLRVPTDAFPATREGLLALGTPERNAIDSQDVTEEYVDVQARVKNLKEQEDKLNELLKEKRKEEKLDDIIKVSDRIAEVRRDVERVQGRLNYLASMTELATIHLTCKEIKDYKPPTAPTFGNRVSATFDRSWDTLVQTGEGVALFFVGITPWLPILVPAVVALVWAVRHYRKADREERVTITTSPAPSSPSTESASVG